MEKTAATSRTSAANAGWLIVVLIVAVPVFIFWPKSPPPPPEAREVIQRTPSALTRVGLPDDPDLEGLPGFFAVWAEHAKWKDNKTIFAYRHPISGEFSFFFEATRTPEGLRFRPINRPDDVPLRELGPEIPVAFFGPDTVDPTTVLRVQRSTLRNSPKVPKVDIDLGEPKASVPAIEPPK